MVYQVIKHTLKLQMLKSCGTGAQKRKCKNKLKHTCLVYDKDGISYTEE